MTATIVDHPAPFLLDAYALGTLPPDRAAEIDEHLSACESCFGRLVTVPDDSFVALLRSAKSAEIFDPTSDFGPIEGTVLQPESAVRPPSELRCEVTRSVGRSEASPDEGIPEELLQHTRYRILERCGAGGMGVVYRAEHRVMNREVALKVIRPELLRRGDAVDRFRREVQAAAALSHPNIVSAYDAEQSEGLHFLVMEYVPGCDLARFVAQQGPLPTRDACDFIQQAALGLAHAHQRGMVHRDVKPQNLMLTPDGRIKILDFGLAKFASETGGEAIASVETSIEGGHLTSVDASLGTPDYVAPEQMVDARTADIRADIYGLGGTFYFLLTGRAPFPGTSLASKLRGHAAETPRPLTDFRDDVPAELLEVIRRMMAKRPQDRYESPKEVAEVLRPFITIATMDEGLHGTAPPVPPSLPPTYQPSDNEAKRKVESPANGILAVTVLNLVLGVWSLGSMPHVYPRENLWAIWAAVGGISMIPATLIMMQGALRMRRLESLPWAKAAAVYAVIPWTPLWFLGLPFGAWALWTLSDPSVRQGFGHQSLPPDVRRRGIIVTCLLLLLPLAAGAGGVVYIETDEGEIVIEAHDPQARIRVLRDGKIIEVLDPVTKESVKVDTGVYTIQLGANGFSTSIPEGKEFLIHRGNRKVVTVRRTARAKATPNDQQQSTTVAVPLIVNFSDDMPPLNTAGVERDEKENAWRIDGMEGRTVRLYEAPLPGEDGKGIDDRLLVYRAKIKARDVTGRVYLEMWVKAEDGLKYFSRGFDDAVSGTTTDWVDVQTPFWLKKGDKVTQAQLNLAIEGGGTVWIKDLQLEAKPRPKTAAQNLGDWLKEQLRRQPTTSVDTLEFDRLVELAEEKLQRVKALHETAAVTQTEVREAELRLLEANIRRAEARGDREDAVRGVQQIIVLAEEHLSQIRERYNTGDIPLTEVSQAERNILEDQVRLAELQNDQDEKVKRLRQMVQLAEEHLARIRKLSEHGVVPQSELRAAQQDVLEATIRLRAAESLTESATELLQRE